MPSHEAAAKGKNTHPSRVVEVGACVAGHALSHGQD